MRRAAKLRRRFVLGLWEEFGVVWPILSGLVAVQLALGALIAYLEGWPVGNGLYFAFVTGLTIGYGDLTPSRFSTRVMAIGIGVTGILVTGLIAAVGVTALASATRENQGG